MQTEPSEHIQQNQEQMSWNVQENEQHRNAEESFKLEIEAKFHRKLLKAPANFRFDYFVCNEYKGVHLATALAELKCRSHAKYTYPTVYIPVDKLKFALGLCSWWGSQVTRKNLTFLYFIKFADVRSYAQLSHKVSLDDFEIRQVNKSEAYLIPTDLFVDF